MIKDEKEIKYFTGAELRALYFQRRAAQARQRSLSKGRGVQQSTSSAREVQVHQTSPLTHPDTGEDNNDGLLPSDESDTRFQLNPQSKQQVQNDNILQIQIMQEAGIPETEMADYALSSVADGKILRTYINEIKAGEITKDEAVSRVRRDYEKMRSGEKEGKFIEPEGTK